MGKAPGTGGGRCCKRIFKGEKHHDQQACLTMGAKSFILSCGLHNAHCLQSASLSWFIDDTGKGFLDLADSHTMNRGEVAKDKSVFLAVAVWEKL